MAKEKVYEIVIKKAVEILKRFPDGLDYGSLTEWIISELPDIQKNTVHGTFTTNFKYFPKNVVKPRRGFYKWIEDNQVDIFKSQNGNIANDLSVINGKLLSIRLKNFQQFADVKLDLTYPIGHEKAGQPLEKICFLGQSGAGKTTILNVIRLFSLSESSKQASHIFDIAINAELEIEYLIPEFASISIYYKNKTLTYKITEKRCNWSDDIFNIKLYEYFQKIEYRLIYFPSDVIKKLDNNIVKTDTIKLESAMEDKVLDFNLLHPSDIWENVITEIQEYKIDYTAISLKLSNTIKNTPNRIEEASKEFRTWLTEHQSPIEKLAKECLDGILNKFGVRVKTELDENENIKFITLETTNGTELNINQWSTGTKHIVFCGMTLYQLKPKNALILFDEPENSLYPDVQNQIVEFYTSMTENCQFFFATHSPIIASSFEPCEIIELKFDESNTYVEQELYYKDERKLENYFLNPQYLTWGRIIKDIFDVKEDSNPKRSKMLDKLAEMDEEIELLMSKGKKQEALAIQKEYEKLADLLKWDLK